MGWVFWVLFNVGYRLGLVIFVGWFVCIGDLLVVGFGVGLVIFGVLCCCLL